MYGTIARLKVKPGMAERFKQYGRDTAEMNIPGVVFEHVYRSDNDPNEYWLVVAFESKASYQANAGSPEQHQRYLQMLELLESAPEWHDGEVVESHTFSGS